jgi:hypothetical protein
MSPADADASGTCNGYVKIWNGANWTGTGLAFEDYGAAQSLASYTSIPFKEVSWFSDGQRGYAAMTNCHSSATDPGSISMASNAEATNLGTSAQSVSYIQLFHN